MNEFIDHEKDEQYSYAAIEQLIDFRRHSKTLANYLDYDGHVQSIPAVAIEEWIQRRWNFLGVGQGSFDD